MNKKNRDLCGLCFLFAFCIFSFLSTRAFLNRSRCFGLCRRFLCRFNRRRFSRFLSASPCCLFLRSLLFLRQLYRLGLLYLGLLNRLGLLYLGFLNRFRLFHLFGLFYLRFRFRIIFFLLLRLFVLMLHDLTFCIQETHLQHAQ